MADSQARVLRAGVLSRIGLVTSVDLAQCILATDVAAYRDNLDYSARRSSRGALLLDSKLEDVGRTGMFFESYGVANMQPTG